MNNPNKKNNKISNLADEIRLADERSENNEWPGFDYEEDDYSEEEW